MRECRVDCCESLDAAEAENARLREVLADIGTEAYDYCADCGWLSESEVGYQSGESWCKKCKGRELRDMGDIRAEKARAALKGKP